MLINRPKDEVFKFVIRLEESDLSDWTSTDRNIFDTACLTLAECFDRPGTLLDTRCANAYLLECAVRWAADYGIEITPYGLDPSDELIAEARQRLPAYADHMFVGTAIDWVPPLTFDYVSTELSYIPDNLRRAFVTRLLDTYLSQEGKLIVAEYTGRKGTTANSPRIEDYLTDLGFRVDDLKVGHLMGVEVARIAVVVKAIE